MRTVPRVRHMNRWQSQVRVFHRYMGLTVGETPEIREPELRARLILEEAFETVEALLGFTAGGAAINASFSEWLSGAGRDGESIVGAIDGMCDLIYVTLGTAVACGVDLEPFYDEVHRSNMAKSTGPRRGDGKVLKPPGWTPPDIAGLLAKTKAKP